MISEIPCTEIPIEASGSLRAEGASSEAPPEAEAEPASQLALEPAENEPAEPLEGAAEPPTPKRKPGRPRKKEASGSLRTEAPPPPVAKPKAPRKPARPESARGMIQEPATLRALPEDPFRATLDNMSAGQLIAELVHRRRAADKEMKQNLYRSFVM